MTLFRLILLSVLIGVNARPTPDEGESSEEEDDTTGYPWENGDQFEGDIIVTPDVRNGILGANKRWPNGIIYYKFKPGDFNAWQKNFVVTSLQAFTRTCIRVVPAPANARDFVLVVRKNGCSSPVGRQGGVQELSLKDDPGSTCMVAHTVVHEFLHAAGFYHQQSAQERDNYIRIFKENIKSGKSHNFDRHNSNNYGVKYDYKSVMHYSNYAFTKNNKPTMEAIGNPKLKLGNNVGMTDSDILKLNRMYANMCQRG